MRVTEDLKVCLIQDDIVWQDPAANRLRCEEHFKNSGESDLIVLPEFFTTGFYTDPTEKFETMDGETVAWMVESAQRFDAVITGSVVMQQDDAFVNRMLWATPEGEIDWYDKRHLFRFGGEHHNYTGGDQRTIFNIAGWSIALFVCYDLRFPVWSRNRNDYDVALYVANWPDARQYAWDTLLRARAIENQVYVMGVNRLGKNSNGDSYSGGSVILNYLGEPIVDCGENRMAAAATLSSSAQNEYKRFFPAAMDSDDFEIRN